MKRSFSSTADSSQHGGNEYKISVAIVGSGPSGCYTAKYLLKAVQDRYTATVNSSGPRISIQHVDILERLPTPYGLVRFGVAPDHPDVKNVQNDFDRLFEEAKDLDHPQPMVRFFGNVHVGVDVSLAELRERYDIVILSYGCQADRKLHIPGEDQLQGIVSAREFVAWYNGHPYFTHIGEKVCKAIAQGSSRNEDVSVVIVGHGNVAIDCARILAKASSAVLSGGLYDTDISLDAWKTLRYLNVRNIFIVGRRGHVQASFTIKELRELTHLGDDGFDTSFIVRKDELDMCLSTVASQEELNGPHGRPKGRIDSLLRDAASKAPNPKRAKQLHLRFLLHPIRFEASATDSTALGGVFCERNRLTGDAGKQSAIGTGEIEFLPAQLALVSIGYKGEALPGTEPWFDSNHGSIQHYHGRVDGRTAIWGALYTAGWIKRGPTGIIGTNIPDAKDTVATIVADLEDFVPRPAVAVTDLGQLLHDRGIQVVDWRGYRRIDEVERAARRSDPQPREKILQLQDQLRTAAQETIETP